MNITGYIGSSTNNIDMIEKLVAEGMTMGRFSLCGTDEHKTKHLIKEIQIRQLPLDILIDLEGNKFRVSAILEKPNDITPDNKVYFCHSSVYERLKREAEKEDIVIPLDYELENFRFTDVKEIVIGKAEFATIFKDKNFIATKTKKTIQVAPYQGVEPISHFGRSYGSIGLTAKDKEDIIWSLENNINIICLSYCDSKERVQELKGFISDNLREGQPFPVIYGKTETSDGVKHYDEVLEEVDGIMLGRGDLSTEVSLTEICLMEKSLIKKANKKNKNIIVATYVLDSMKNSIKPTLAEINTIFNELNYGKFEYMLSKEVGLGKYPVETVKTLKNILSEFEG